MSVYRRMLGRELPCGLGDLLEFEPGALEPQDHQQLNDRALLGQASPSELHLLALSCLAQGQAGLAAEHLTAALRRNPNDARLRLSIALALEADARHERAAQQIDVVLRNEATEWARLPARSTLWCAAGFQHERAGAWRSAIRRYAQALRVCPGELFAHHRLVAIYLAHGQLSQAALHLRAVLQHSPADKSARVCLAHLLLIAGRHEEAVWEYEQALCLEPDSWELPASVAGELIQSGSEGAIAILEKLVRSQPHFPDLRMRLGNLYSQRGDDKAASLHFHRALTLHPEYLDCHIAVARHELRMGRPDMAAEHFRRAIDINEQNVETYVGLAMALNGSGRTSQGAEIIASAGRIGRNSAVLVAQLALLERFDGNDGARTPASELRGDRIEDLLDRGRQTLARHPYWNDVRIHCGMLQRLMGRSDCARHTFTQAVETDAQCTEAWMQLGLALADANQPNAAAEMFTAALSFDPRRGLLEYRLGLIHCGRLEFELALEKTEDQSADAIDANRRIWVAIDSMHMEGLTRRRVGHASKPTVA